jgi:EmrB/QacA subfamily drug resistance transporter
VSTTTLAAGGPAALVRPIGNRYLFLGLAAVCQLMFAVDSSIVAVALRSIVFDLDTTLAWVSWTLTAYALTQTVAMPVVGKLAEQFGQMRVFVICVVVFTFASLLCGLAPTVYVLIACRVLQALGGGGIMPSAVSIIARTFPEQRNRMLGLFTSIFPLGGIIGPNLGGLLLQHFDSWRILFLINVPVGLIVVPLLARHIRTYDRQAGEAGTTARRIDLVGAGLFAGAIVALLMALTFVGDDPSMVRTPGFWLVILASLGLFVLFYRHERRIDYPIIDLKLVTKHPYLVVNIHNFIFGACVWGCFSFVPYYAAVQYGMSPLESGAIMTPRSITSILLGTATSFMLTRLGYRLPIIVGLAIISLSNVILGQGWDGLTLGPLIIAPFFLLALNVGLAGVGSGMTMPATNNAILDLMPERAGVISAMRGMCRSTGGIIGTAVVVVMLELSPDKAAGLRTMFTAYGLLLLIAIPLTFLIPDMKRKIQPGRRSDGGAPIAARETVNAVGPARH